MRIFLLFGFLLCLEMTFAQNSSALWPIQDAKQGEVILSKPQEYIGEELNIDNLIIGAKENTNVLCPKDGKIISISYIYHSSLAYCIMVNSFDNVERIGEIDMFDKKKRIDITDYINKSKKDKPVNAKFISVSITIAIAKGENYIISGLRPTKLYKTGELLKKGDVIGKVGYCYWKIDTPSICFSHSLSSKSVDPMSVFGLKTTFLPPKVSKINYLNYKHPTDSLLKAFQIFRNSLEEGHPGLYDYTSKIKMDSIFENLKRNISEPMTSEEFRNLLLPVMLALRDSHTALRASLYKVNDESEAPFMFGVVDGKLRIVSCINKYNAYLDKEVAKINGEDAGLVIKKVKNTVYGSDGFIESSKERALMNGFMKYYRALYQANDGFVLDIMLVTGEHIVDKFSKTNIPEPEINYVAKTKKNLVLKKITDKCAYLELGTFDLLQKEEEEIRNFIKDISASNIKNLIIDLRFNRGGSTEVMNNLFAIFANTSFQSSSQSMVNKNDTYNFFKYTSNFTNSGNIFPEYNSVQGKTGYYLNTEHFEFIKPNDSIHFGGTVYVLTNEYSFSASAVFAGLMVKYNRGIIVGRETGSTYYQLNAEKFANVMLGETGLELYMPLVKDIFSEERIPRIPWGRGVIPDYIIKSTVDDAYQKEDKILNFTLGLIDKSF
ncbi:MAG: S41 family peptidase [Paludibacter sp.]|nr:S41 family peptidase [Paludibacter sp.]